VHGLKRRLWDHMVSHHGRGTLTEDTFDEWTLVGLARLHNLIVTLEAIMTTAGR
jgi:hypothetical protein